MNKYFLVLITLIFIFSGCTLKLQKIEKVKVKEIKDCTANAKIYYQNKDITIYTKCIRLIKVSDNKTSMELSKYIKNNISKINDIIDILLPTEETVFNEKTEIYLDNQNNFTLIKCNTLEEKYILYFVPKNLIDENYCK